MTNSVAAQTSVTTVVQLERAERRKNIKMGTAIGYCILCPLIAGGTIWIEGARNNQSGIASASLAIVIVSAAFDVMLAFVPSHF